MFFEFLFWLLIAAWFGFGLIITLRLLAAWVFSE